MKRFLLSATCAALAAAGFASVPDGYYDSLAGKYGKELKDALYEILINHEQLGYDDLWDYFYYTDVYPEEVDGKILVWDMYYDNWTNQTYYYPDNTTGLNREHCVPKSWWGSGSTTSEIEQYPAGTDLHQLYPADGSINSSKGNAPLGIVDTDDTGVYSNGVSKVGNPASGYGGGATRVFEPADQYKGDFARTYLYFVCCYQDYTWDSDYMYMFQNYSDNPLILQDWALDMLLAWHEADPVSTKEKSRNETVYDIQGNRNPFIDDPDLVSYIWGDKATAQEEYPGYVATDVTYYLAGEFNNWLGITETVNTTEITIYVNADSGDYTMLITDQYGNELLGSSALSSLSTITIDGTSYYYYTVTGYSSVNVTLSDGTDSTEITGITKDSYYTYSGGDSYSQGYYTTASATFVAGTDVYTGDNISTSGYAWTLTKDNVTATCSDGIADIINYSNLYYSCYKGSTLTISSDYTISQIVLTSPSRNTSTNYCLTNLSVEEGEFVEDTSSSYAMIWTGNSNSIVFTAEALTRITSIDVTYIVPSEVDPDEINTNTITIYVSSDSEDPSSYCIYVTDEDEQAVGNTTFSELSTTTIANTSYYVYSITGYDSLNVWFSDGADTNTTSAATITGDSFFTYSGGTTYCNVEFTTATATFVAGTDVYTGDDISTSGYAWTLTKDNVTLDCTLGMADLTSTGNVKHYRIYKGYTLTVSSDYTICNVTFTSGSANSANTYGCDGLTADVGSYTFESSANTGEWTGFTSPIVFTAEEHQVRPNQIDVTYILSATATEVTDSGTDDSGDTDDSNNTTGSVTFVGGTDIIDDSGLSSSGYEWEITKTPITVNCSKGIAGTYHYDTNYYRIYTDQTLTFTADDGYVITQISMTSTSKNSSTSTSSYGLYHLSADSGTFTEDEDDDYTKIWTGEASTVVFTSDNQVRLTQIVVTYAVSDTGTDGNTDDTDDSGSTDSGNTDTDTGGTTYTETTVTFSYTDGDLYSGEGISTGNTGYTFSLTKEDVTLAFTRSKGDNTENTSLSAYKVYNNGTVTVTANGYTITTIVLTSSSKNSSSSNSLANITVDDDMLTYENESDYYKTWSGEDTEVVFTASGATNIVSFKVTYLVPVTTTSAAAKSRRSAAVKSISSDYSSYAFSDQFNNLALVLSSSEYSNVSSFKIYGDDGTKYGYANSVDYKTKYAFTKGAATATISTEPSNDYLVFLITKVSDEDDTITVMVCDASESDIETGITNITDDEGTEIHIIALGGQISVIGSNDVAVYNLAGNLISRSNTTVAPNGVYIVRAGNTVSKVMLR